MSKPNNFESLNKISSSVSERDKKIWENEAHSICIKRATEQLDNEIILMEKSAKNLEKENITLERRLSEISESIAVQKKTLQTCQQSLLAHKTLKENLIQRRDEMRRNYDKILQMYEDEYQEYRAICINNSKGYKDLREKQVRLKKLEIIKMDLNIQIRNLEKIRQQFMDIQNQILRVNIMKFAKFYVLYHKNEQVGVQLEERKDKEKQLMKQHLELVRLVKEKQQVKKAEERKQKQIANITADKSSNQETQDLKKDKNSANDRLQKFLQEEIKPCSLTSLDSVSQHPQFNKENSKVRLLEMKIVRPPSFHNQTVQKPDLELRKKMETVMEMTRKSALRSCCPQHTPTASQQSQKSQNEIVRSTKLSQNSQEKSLTPKENINPILKQNKEDLVQGKPVEKTITTKDETTSKFFTVKKKSVTFQNRINSSTSQEENQIRETENKFTFQSGTTSKENVEPKLADKFSFKINKENVKSVEFKSIDVFRKPFTFTSETIAKQEKKNSGFNMFSRQLNDEKTQNPTGQTETTIGNTSSSGGFTTGPESTGKQTSEESMFDPFEASFNHKNFVQSSLNVTQEFAPAPEPTSFNFFGSQNKNNLFTMF